MTHNGLTVASLGRSTFFVTVGEQMVSVWCSRQADTPVSTSGLDPSRFVQVVRRSQRCEPAIAELVARC